VHDIYNPEFSSGNVTPWVHDRYKETFTFNFKDYIGGLSNSNKKWLMENEYNDIDFTKE